MSRLLNTTAWMLLSCAPAAAMAQGNDATADEVEAAMEAAESAADAAEAAAAAIEAEAAAAIDPARLVMARRVVDRIWPLGTYERMMGDSMREMMDVYVSSIMGMPAHTGMGQTDGVMPDGTTVREVTTGLTMREALAARDPHYEERMRIAMDVTMPAMTRIMIEAEPAIRAALSRAYARRLSLEDLTAMAGFFETPVGDRVGREMMLIYADPEIMSAMEEITPRLMAEIPSVATAIRAATAHLPPPPVDDIDQEPMESGDQ